MALLTGMPSLAPALAPGLAPGLAQSAAPAGTAVVLVAGLIAGLLLWLVGGKVLKPAFAIIGMALGGFAGLVLVPLVGLPSFQLSGVTIGPDAVGLIVGAVVGAGAALALLKFVVILSSGVVFAAIGAVVALVVLQHAAPLPGGETSPGSVDGAVADAAGAIDDAAGSVQGTLDSLRDQTQGLADDARARLEGLAGDMAGDRAQEEAGGLLSDEQMDAAKAGLKTAAERSRAFLSRVREAAGAEWDRRTAREKTVLFGAGLVGLLLGLVAGVVFPTRSVALVSALLGAGVWLACGLSLARTNGFELGAMSPRSWAIVWAGTAAVGMAIQLGVLKKRERRAAARDDDEDDEDE